MIRKYNRSFDEECQRINHCWFGRFPRLDSLCQLLLRYVTIEIFMSLFVLDNWNQNNFENFSLHTKRQSYYIQSVILSSVLAQYSNLGRLIVRISLVTREKRREGQVVLYCTVHHKTFNYEFRKYWAHETGKSASGVLYSLNLLRNTAYERWRLSGSCMKLVKTSVCGSVELRKWEVRKWAKLIWKSF